jgi:hypothetical protein
MDMELDQEQTPTPVPSHQRKVNVEGIGSFYVPDNTPDAVIDAKVQEFIQGKSKNPLDFLPGPTGKDPSAGLRSIPPKEFVNDMIGTGLKVGNFASSFIPGTGLPSIAARIAGSGLFGGADAALEGKSPIEGAVNSAALQGGGEGVASVVPRVTTAGALLLGGQYKNIPQIVKSFMDERARRGWGRAFSVGSSGKVKRAGQELGAKLEQVETANPSLIPVDAFKGTADDLINQASNRVEPIGKQVGLAQQEDSFLRQHNLDKSLPPTGPNAKNVSKRSGPYAPGKGYFTVRELGDLKRNVAHEGESVITAKKEGQFIPSSEQEQQQWRAAVGKRAKELQESVDIPAPVTSHLKSTGQIGQVNERLSDVNRIKDAINRIGNKAHTIGPLSHMGIRGGLGAGAAGSIGYVLGLDPMEAAKIGGAFGLFGLAPINLSRLGYATGRAGELFPPIVKGADLIGDVEDKYIKPAPSHVTRRKP